MWKYWLDWVVAPIVALVVGVLTYSGPWWLAGAAFGAVLFTFVEYWTHRVLLHKLFWHGEHERHHIEPHVKTVFPIWWTPTLFGGFFLVLPYSVFAGMLVGYGWFLFWHHALHFWRMDEHPWVRQYANWHNVHHNDEPANYGITVPVWDWLFGTYRSASR
jgi:sterol desaturase/sphingolipid hydroxylase (fatty acid hydroxylase superfamily)